MRNLYILLLAISFVGCSKFLDVNENPNKPGSSTLPLKTKLSAAILSTSIQESIQINQIGGFWGGYWGTPNEALGQFADLKQYNGLAIRHQREGIKVWEEAYANLNYFQLIIDEATLNNDPFYSGLGKIMQGALFLRLVDFYNHIPFTDALKGTALINPSYENGKSVYEKSIHLITAGIEDIKLAPNSTTVDPGNHDILFNGDKTKWIQLANTLKLRALIRQSETNNTDFIQAQINIIQNEGTGFLKTDAIVNPGFTASNGNPFYIAYYRDQAGASTANRENIRPTEFLIQTLTDLNDPRITSLFTEVGGNYQGVLFGNPSVGANHDRASTSAFKGPNENSNAPAGIFKNMQQGLVYLSAAESAFLQAEAMERGWLSGNAAELYIEGITQSFKYLELNTSDLNSYLAQSAVDYSVSTNKIETIIQQKWIALYGNSNIEAWNDYRRLGYPAIPNSLSAPTPQSRPLRLMYPETERMTNNTNVSKAGSDDVLNSAVWWDQ